MGEGGDDGEGEDGDDGDGDGDGEGEDRLTLAELAGPASGLLAQG